jgi:hypothetical protein
MTMMLKMMIDGHDKWSSVDVRLGVPVSVLFFEMLAYQH